MNESRRETAPVNTKKPPIQEPENPGHHKPAKGSEKDRQDSNEQGLDKNK